MLYPVDNFTWYWATKGIFLANVQPLIFIFFKNKIKDVKFIIIPEMRFLHLKSVF